MYKRVILFVFSLVFLFTFSFTSYATGDFKSELGSFLGKDISEDDAYNWSLVISTLKSDGFSNEAIAGILGNVKAEGGTNQFAIEGYSGKKTNNGKTYTEFEVGNSYDFGDTKPGLYTNKKGKTMGGEGHGLVQWSFGRADNLTKFAESSNFGFVTVTHWKKSYDSGMQQHTCKIPNVAGQVCFMVQELNTSYQGVKNNIVNSNSASNAAEIFHNEYEKSGTKNISERKSYAESALSVVNSCSSVVGTKGSTINASSQEQQIADALVACGIWGEDEFVKFSELAETKLTYPDRSKLNDSQLKGVVDWRNNIEYGNEDGIIKYLRVGVMLFGIVFLVWVILIYLSYWFDRINNFIDIELLPIITFGKLRVSPEENDCSFSPKNYKKGQEQTVNHRTVCVLCIIGVFFSILIISGVIYTGINFIFRRVLNLVGLA